MAGLNKKIVYLSIVLTFVLIYLLFLLPYYNSENYIKLLDLVFLDFSVFKDYHLSKFNIRYITVFILFFITMYHQQLTALTENVSFLSLVYYRKSKSEVIHSIYKEHVIDNIKLFLIIIVVIFGVNMISAFALRIDVMNIEQFIKVILYLVKYFIIIVTSLVTIHLIIMVKKSSYDLLIPYIILCLFLIIDYTFGTSFITISNSISSELVYLLIVLSICILLHLVIHYKIKKSKEIYYD